jgi:hypothetical protein
MFSPPTLYRSNKKKAQVYGVKLKPFLHRISASLAYTSGLEVFVIVHAFFLWVERIESPIIHTGEFIMTDTPNTEERPRIGDFTRPGDKTPEPPPSTKEATPPAATEKEPAASFTPPPTESEEEAQERLTGFDKMQAALTPITDYKKFLKQQGITEDKATVIVDDLLVKSAYQETFHLSKSISIDLRTRQQDDLLRLQAAMKAQRPVYDDAIDELVTRYNMAASLVRYHETTFEFPMPGADSKVREGLFDKRLEYVENLPAPVFSAISTKLAKFDWVVMAVMQEGVAENF